MKILLISLPRSGSHSMMDTLSIKNNLKKYSEPFNKNNRDLYLNKNWILEKNYILKSITNQVPLDNLNNIEFYLKFSNHFDKIILLGRRNLKECAESLSYLDWNIKRGFKHDEHYDWKLTPNFNNSYNFVKQSNLDLISISELLNIPIIYYEDIFDINSQDRLRNTNINKTIL